MNEIKFNKLLLRLAKLLEKLAPDGCITNIHINKVIKDRPGKPELSISYFEYNGYHPNGHECVATAKDHHNGVDIDYSIFEPRKQPVKIDIKKSLQEQA